MPIEPDKLRSLLSNTENLINQIYWFMHKVQKPIGASHRGVAITYVDIKEKRDDFLRELKSTMLNWVYAKQKYVKIYEEELLRRNNDLQNTNAYLVELVQNKFRKGHPQGQFGELLLFNFIQFFFKAPPLLRKMPITTNPNLERNGADAIHYHSNGKNDLFILGESKCYKSKYSFNSAIKESISSIIESFNNLENELALYIYDDFVDPELEGIAKEFINGKCMEARIELVCLIAYNETIDIDDETEDAIKSRIEQCIINRLNCTKDDLCDDFRKAVVGRIHYVVFPCWRLDELLNRF